MEWKEFIQLLIIFPLFVGGLAVISVLLQNAGLDTSFLISFILAILTIVLSIYYSDGTNKIFNKITEKIESLHGDNKGVGAKLDALKEKIDKYETHSNKEGEKENGE
jgi:hypothetical protein